MGNLQNVWRHYLKDGEPQVLNFFAIGDAAIRTNPLYGRGCSSGVVERASAARARSMHPRDPVERAKIYDRELTARDPALFRLHGVARSERHPPRRARTQSELPARPARPPDARASPRTD